jgi:hypothetical protein
MGIGGRTNWEGFKKLENILKKLKIKKEIFKNNLSKSRRTTYSDGIDKTQIS